MVPVNRNLMHTRRDDDIYRALAQGVEYVFISAVDGHFAEFGTASGKTATFLAACIKHYKISLGCFHDESSCVDPEIFLFDSFEGMPETVDEVEKEAPLVKIGHWGAGTLKGISAEELRASCEDHLPAEKIHIHEGFFQDTLSSIPKGAKFAMVHIDCDLYQSTYDVLDYLFANNHFADGATIYFDDWNCNRASPRWGERRAWAEIVKKHNVSFSDRGEYAFLGHRFFIHVDGA